MAATMADLHPPPPTAADLLRGRCLVLLAAFGWSFSGVAVKGILPVGDLAISGWRSLVTLLLYLAVFAWAVRFRAGAAAQALRAALRHPAAWGATVAFAGTLLFFIAATTRTTAANAILLQYTAPLYVALLSWPLLGEPIRPREWLTLAVCLLGMACFFAERLAADSMTGNLLALASGVACSLNMLCLRLLARQTPPAAGGDGAVTASPAGADPRAARAVLARALPAVLAGNALVVLICLPHMAPQPAWPPHSATVLVLLGLGQLGLPYLLFTVGMAWIPAVEGVLLATLEAILNPVWTALGAGEVPSPAAGAGGILVLGSLTLFALGRQPEPSGEEPPTASPAPVAGP